MSTKIHHQKQNLVKIPSICQRFDYPPIWNENKLDTYVRRLVDEVFHIPCHRRKVTNESIQLVGASSDNFTELEAFKRTSHPSLPKLSSTQMKVTVRDVGTNVNFLIQSQPKDKLPKEKLPKSDSIPTSTNQVKEANTTNPILKEIYSNISLKIFPQYVLPSRRSKKTKTDSINPPKLKSSKNKSVTKDKRTETGVKPSSTAVQSKNENLKRALADLKVQKLPPIMIRGTLTVQEIYNIELPPLKPSISYSHNNYYEEIKY